MAKTWYSFFPGSRCEWFTVSSLHDFVEGKEEMLLFLVRAIGCHVHRILTFRPAYQHFFMSTGKKFFFFFLNTISDWLREVINRVYMSASDIDCMFSILRAHELSSIALFNSSRRILLSISYGEQGHLCYTPALLPFFFRDLTHKSMSTFSTKSVMAAQQVCVRELLLSISFL